MVNVVKVNDRTMHMLRELAQASGRPMSGILEDVVSHAYVWYLEGKSPKKDRLRRQMPRQGR